MEWDSINSLLGKIERMEDQNAKKAAYENTFHLILEALSNSKKYWETINVDYISNKCMSMAFEDLINAIGTTVLHIDDILQGYGGYFVDSQQGIFLNIKYDLDDIAKSKMQSAFESWNLIFAMECDPVETPRYVKCAKAFEDFMKNADKRFFNNRLKAANIGVMDAVETKLSAVVMELLVNDDADCICLDVYHKIFSTYFAKSEEALIQKIEQKMKQNCKEGCPYLWDVTFKQVGSYNSNKCWGEGIEDWQVSEVNGYARFTNVLIYTPNPDKMPNMSSEQWKACRLQHKNFMDSSQQSVGKTFYLMYSGYQVTPNQTATLEANEAMGCVRVWDYDGKGVSLKEFKEHMARFKTPALRTGFSLTGECGVVYYFTPIPAYSDK